MRMKGSRLVCLPSAAAGEGWRVRDGGGVWIGRASRSGSASPCLSSGFVVDGSPAHTPPPCARRYGGVAHWF